MDFSSLPNENLVLLLGAPRSGTTWLAKIFDSHPDVLYRHEPDTVLRGKSIPGVCGPAEIAAHKDAARDYLRRLMDVRTLKSAGSLPIFPKSFENPVRRTVRSGLIYGLRLAEQVPRMRRAARRMPIPDMVSGPPGPDVRMVIKSVSSRGRARLFAEAMPGCRIVFILRDPCGQVASMMRGSALGKFESEVPLDELLATEQAARYGLTAARLHALTPVERFAWHWAVLNEKAIEDLQGVANACVFRYQDLAADPIGEARKLFEFAGLSWHRQSAAFVESSTRYSGPERYYQVFKNTADAANKWRSELGRDDVKRITGVVRATPLWSLCPELQEFAAA